VPLGRFIFGEGIPLPNELKDSNEVMVGYVGSNDAVVKVVCLMEEQSACVGFLVDDVIEVLGSLMLVPCVVVLCSMYVFFVWADDVAMNICS